MSSKVDRAYSTDMLRLLAQSRLPKFVFDLIEGGAGNETTLRANRNAFEELGLRPRCATAAKPVDTSTQVLGETINVPIMVAPCGSARQLHPQGELAIARAAHSLGTGYVVPHLGSYSLEEVRVSTTGLLWYQIYLMCDRDREQRAIERAWSQGYKALVLTVDTPAGGIRERDLRNGLHRVVNGTAADKLRFLPQLLSRPAWFYQYLRQGAALSVPNMNAPDLPARSAAEHFAAASQVPAPATWRDLEWCRKFWPGKMIVKGVLTAADAKRAGSLGVDAIIVSNHGGRQLDGVIPSIQALPAVVDAVDRRVEVYLDSGVRRGWDVVKALSLGARAVLVGRPVLYGLAAGGELGVHKALTLLIQELERTMVLMGRKCSRELSTECVNVPAAWRFLGGDV